MAIIEFNVNINPVNCYAIIKNHFDETNFISLVYDDLKHFDHESYGILIYEKTDGCKPSITIIIDNTTGITNIKLIGHGEGTGWLYRFDWCDYSFSDIIKKLLNEYIIE